MILGSLPCGCHIDDEGDDALHIYPCCDTHGEDLANAARSMSLPTESDDPEYHQALYEDYVRAASWSPPTESGDE